MSVGVIIGTAFTGVVNGLSEHVLNPLINWFLSLVLKTDGLEGVITMLSPSYEAGVLDLANSIYIDWGAFISAIINFLLIAFVLFTIVKVINRINEAAEKAAEGLISNEKKELIKIRREMKISYPEAREILNARIAEAKAKKAEEDCIAAEKAAAEAKLAEEKATANTRLLEEIRDLLKNK
jgi:large conductance mechanosensitive channel